MVGILGIGELTLLRTIDFVAGIYFGRSAKGYTC